MKILIEQSTKNTDLSKYTDGLILSLKNYSSQSYLTYTFEEIEQIIKDNPDKEIFINLNKNFFNDEIESLKEILLKIDKLNVKGIFFYDLAILQLKKECNLKTDLIWSQTYMVNNYKTCNYYHSKGVKYALLSKEITLEEIKEIITKSKIEAMVETVSMPSVAFSKRKLLTNYYHNLNKEAKKNLVVTEKATNEEYQVLEDETGTNFFLNKITNATSIIKELYSCNCPYIILREYGIDHELFKELLIDTQKYIESKCQDEEYINKYESLNDFTNFFFKKTIYQVKKNG
ncbi:MAG: U32 family peptidase [Tenericutes bacterium]|nr:U32 family peptidase [Mycoplasmatota bacterium]MDD6264068.1 U32 family peptidase [bacterium]